MAADQTLESLESRFADLERKILGESTSVDTLTRTENESVVDLLVEAGASMRTALSGRDKIASIVPRMGELDRYLDPTFEDLLDVSSLVELLLSGGSSLRESQDQLERLVELSPVLDSEAIDGVAMHGDRIERLTLANLENRDLMEEGCARLYTLVDEYNAVVVNITKTLVQWDDALTQLELERRPKKVVE